MKTTGGAAGIARGAWFFLTCLAAFAEEPVRRYALPAGDAAEVLAEFVRLADVQLVFPVQVVRGVRTRALHGDFSVREALDQLLADTGLQAVQDASTGAYAVRRARPPPTPTVKAPAPLAEPEAPARLEAVRVEQWRDLGVTTQSILPTDRVAPLYHHVVTRSDIEQSGVTNIAEFLTTVPGYSGEGAESLQATADLAYFGNANVYVGSFLKLRGWDSQHTAVLLNGRHLPASPESRGPDLSRIPLAAVERIELMPFAGSAMYGDGAVGGAMNIVLRKDFTGRSFSFQAGDSTRGAGRELFATWVEGLTSRDGRTKATIIADYQRRGEMRLGDTDFLRRAIERVPPSRVRPGVGPVGPDLRPLARAELTGYPSVFALSVLGSDLGIPGRPGAEFALIPAGRNAGQLQPSSFLEIDPTGMDAYRQDRVVLRRPSTGFNLNVQFEHAVAPERLEFYGEAGYSRADEDFFAPDAVEPLALGILDPRNPFRRDVTPGFTGRSVMFYFDPVDLPDAQFRQTRDSVRAVFGVRGRPSPRWHWAFDSFADVSRSGAELRSYVSSLNELLRAWTPARADSLAAIYDPFADHRTSPVSAEIRERYFARRSWLEHESRMFGADLRAGGRLLDLPAGPLHVAFGAEYAWRDVETRQHTEAQRELTDLLSMSNAAIGSTAAIEPKLTNDQGERIGAIAELTAPLWRGREAGPLHSVDLNLASRVARADNGHPAVGHLAALKVAPSRSLAFRAAFSSGYVTPGSSLVHSPVVDAAASVAVLDRRRGGVQQVYPVRMVRGGSRALRAETSHAAVFGLLLTPAAAPGLFVSVDAWSITMRDRLRAPTAQELVDHADFFPGKIERALPQSWELALGWDGPVTRVDLRPVHVARLEAGGVDIAFRYRFPESRAGNFSLNAQAETVQRYEEQLIPGTQPVDKVGTVADASSGGLMESAVVTPRGRATLAWQRGPWFASATANYAPPYRTESTTPTPALPAATGVDGEFVGSSTRWDLQVGYTPRARRRAAWLSGTTWMLGVRNIFDRAPPHRSDGTSFYSRFDDPRMRFIYARVQWRR